MMHFRENPLYHLHEMHYAAIGPLRAFAGAAKHLHSNPFSPLAYTGFGRHVAAAAEVIERITTRYGKPEFGIKHTKVDGKSMAIEEEAVEESPFCRLLHFRK